MPAKSKSQQRLMAMALLYKRGKLPVSKASKTIKDIADSMSEVELKKYAGTDTKGLPEKIQEIVNRGNSMRSRKLQRLVEQTVKEVLTESSHEEETPPMSPEEVQENIGRIKRFQEYGTHIYRNKGLGEVYENIKKIVEFAENNLVEESGEWFDDVTAKRHSRRLKESMKVFEKTAKDVMKLQQRLESAYEDIGETLNKYYEVADTTGQVESEMQPREPEPEPEPVEEAAKNETTFDPKQFVYHTDPGHGWLEVPSQLIYDLGIEKDITNFSYISRDGKIVYLEEDSDMTTFIKEAQKKFAMQPHMWLPKVKRSDKNAGSPIRNLPPYSMASLALDN